MKYDPRPDFERYMTALRCQEPDRVPLGDVTVDQEVQDAYMGRKIRTLEDRIAFQQQAGFDFIVIEAGLFSEVRAEEGLLARADASTSLYEKSGRERAWAHSGEGVITNEESFERHVWPEIDAFDFSTFDEVKSLLPGNMKVILNLGKVFTAAWMYMGMEHFFMTVMENEPLVSRLIQKIGEIQCDVFERVMAKETVGACLMADDLACNTGCMMAPKYFRNYVFPWYAKMGELARQMGKGYVMHTDGDVSAVLEDIIDCGFQGFHPVQPDVMDICEVKRQVAGRLCLLGNIDLNGALSLGTPEEVREEVRVRIRDIAPGGGYMVSSSNSVTNYVPLENFEALLAATREFGQYPITA